MKWTVKVEPENEHDEQALRQANDAIPKHGLSACIVGLSEQLKGEGAAKYTNEHAAIVVASFLSAYLKSASDKR